MQRWIVVAGLAGLALVAAEKSFTKPLSKEQRIQHALERLTFGPRPGDTETVARMGLEKWLDAQLHPEKIAESAALTARLDTMATLRLTSDEIADRFQIPLQGAVQAARDEGKDAAAKQLKQQLKQQAGQGNGPGVPIRELNEAKILRAVYSERQLEEQLVDFWFNHFNVNAQKGAVRLLLTSYERDAIRPHIWGKFRDLLGATAEHPAMLFYLDNWQSAVPQAQGLFAKAKAKQAAGINENYARELLELHTLGVDNGYTQQDIVEVARCFTGWTILQPRQGGDFAFVTRMHDRGEKTVLGLKIAAGGGKSDGDRVLDILARRPETAHFISLKLGQRFVADDPPASIVDRMTKTFRDTDGDLRAVVTTMVQSPEFFSEAAFQAKMKTPLEYVASVVRASGAEVRNAAPLAQKIGDLGQPLYRKVEPTGFSTMAAEWVNSGALLQRMNLALDLTSNRVPGTRVASGESDKGQQYGSPEFQRR